MKFWWTTIKEQKAEIEFLKTELQSKNNLQISLQEISNRIFHIEKKVLPMPIKTYSIDAIELAKRLQKYPKLKRCGGGSCEMRYQIPLSEIDKIAASKPAIA